MNHPGLSVATHQWLLVWNMGMDPYLPSCKYINDWHLDTKESCLLHETMLNKKNL